MPFPFRIFFSVLLTCTGLIIFAPCTAQKLKADSVMRLMKRETLDSNKVKLYCQLAKYTDIYNPDTAVFISQQALFLARRIKYLEGESSSLGVLSNSFIKSGNYPRALKLSLERLQLEEQRKMPENMAAVMISIGVIYVLQKDFENALPYYRSADSLISKFNIRRLKYYTALNLGDVYNRMNVADSAKLYFDRSLDIAEEQNDIDFIGTSFTGLGHVFVKKNRFDSALICYRNAVDLLEAADDDETYCEASLGLANLFSKLNIQDSAAFYAYKSYNTSIGKFPLKELDAVSFLSDFYKHRSNVDSAFIYLNKMIALNDSINNNNRIKELQILSSNEKFRQFEIEEANKLAEAERKQRLQLLFIGIFIPGFFLFTLLLSRVRIPVKVIRVLGILSLLFFFEYITILLHPAVQNLTHHTPWIEILIFVAIGAVLVPAHHRMEHWVIHRLLESRLSKTKSIDIAETQTISEEPVETEEAEMEYENEIVFLEEEIPSEEKLSDPAIESANTEIVSASSVEEEIKKADP